MHPRYKRIHTLQPYWLFQRGNCVYPRKTGSCLWLLYIIRAWIGTSMIILCTINNKQPFVRRVICCISWEYNISTLESLPCGEPGSQMNLTGDGQRRVTEENKRQWSWCGQMEKSQQKWGHVKCLECKNYSVYSLSVTMPTTFQIFCLSLYPL